MAPEPGRRAATLRGRAPGLELERSLQETGARVVGGMDEVGRGALAGPVTAGLVKTALSTLPKIASMRPPTVNSPSGRYARTAASVSAGWQTAAPGNRTSAAQTTIEREIRIADLQKG